jgi:hypothetical protein
MRRISFVSLLLASTLATGCAYENKTEFLNPLAPSSTGSGSTQPNSTATGTSGSSSSSGTTPASAFGGAWGSSTLAGLPIGNCGDVKWLITAQSASSVSGTVTASCANGIKVDANLTGTIQSENVISLAANGTITAMGLPCQISLNATGTRQAGDTMRVDYNGTYCFGTVSGSETLRKFPNI